MKMTTYRKRLTANDVGLTGTHQSGIHIPHSEIGLLKALPALDPNSKNPEAWLQCEDEFGELHQFRFIYYNNRLHDDRGTRNEYRITRITKYFRVTGAEPGDEFEISKISETKFAIKTIKRNVSSEAESEIAPTKVKLSGWRQIH